MVAHIVHGEELRVTIMFRVVGKAIVPTLRFFLGLGIDPISHSSR